MSSMNIAAQAYNDYISEYGLTKQKIHVKVPSVGESTTSVSTTDVVLISLAVNNIGPSPHGGGGDCGELGIVIAVIAVALAAIAAIVGILIALAKGGVSSYEAVKWARKGKEAHERSEKTHDQTEKTRLMHAETIYSGMAKQKATSATSLFMLGIGGGLLLATAALGAVGYFLTHSYNITLMVFLGGPGATLLVLGGGGARYAENFAHNKRVRAAHQALLTDLKPKQG